MWMPSTRGPAVKPKLARGSTAFERNARPERLERMGGGRSMPERYGY